MSSTLEYYFKSGHVVAAGVVLSVVDIIAVILRFRIRRAQRQPLLADDWLMIPALLITTGIGICLVYGASQKALGYPANISSDSIGSSLEVSNGQVSTAFKIEFSVISMIPLALGCVKGSFLFFYRRIFSVHSAVDRLLIGMIALVALWTFGFFFAMVFECGLNFWAVWGPNSSAKNETAHCVNSLHLALSFVVSDFITDVIIICIPVPLIWRLNLSTAKKMAVITIFLLGAVTVGASMTRLLIVTKDVRANVNFNPYEDQILVITEYLYWGMIECGIGVLAACFPTLQFLLRGWSLRSFVDSTKSLLGSRSSRMRYINASQQSIYNVDRSVDGSYTKEQNRSTHASLPRPAKVVSRDSKAESYPMRDWEMVGDV
ncbi:hypothetical protein F4804DRAFT_23669 [Jackrogersella minutella]|nr:hypothetical protein F4804DRAFT_23669 [Jackrogersella minutella]